MKKGFTLISLLYRRKSDLRPSVLSLLLDKSRRSCKGFTLISRSERAFTLIELMIVMGIILILTAGAVIGLLQTQTQISVDGAITTVVADLKHQQIKAMMGESLTSTTSDHGVYLETGQYTLFAGPGYISGDSNNLTFSLETNVLISGALPIQIVFIKRSGEIAAPLSFTITHSGTGEQKIVNINKFGVISIN